METLVSQELFFFFSFFGLLKEKVKGGKSHSVIKGITGPINMGEGN